MHSNVKSAYKSIDVAIIGGGAAGMMVAATLLENGGTKKPSIIALFEKNKILGQKVIISGGGRCNVTTGITDIKEVLKKYPRGSKCISYALYEFSPQKVMDWFEDHGVPLKIEEDFRVFPVSNNGHDVVGAFEYIFSSEKYSPYMNLALGKAVIDVIKRDNNEYSFELIVDTGEHYSAKKLVITTGGQAYRQTGSTGDGYYFAQKLGHSITPLGPSLNSFFVEAQWTKKCAGVSIEKAALTLKNKETWHTTGPFVFTHRGLSGPAIFVLSAYSAFQTISASTPMQLMIDFFPQENEDIFAQRFAKLINNHPKKNISNVIDMLLPKSLAVAALSVANVEHEKNAAEVSRDQQRELIHFMKNATVKIVGRGAGEEFVTAGGISTAEIELKTLESKICPGLFFAGEILDVDGFTGGFNLQASWSTSRLVGKSLSRTSTSISCNL